MKNSDERIQQLKVWTIYSALGLGVAAGLYFVGRHFIRKVKATTAQKHSLEEGDPATFAKQLKMAFENDNWFGWGTNEELITKVFLEIPTKSMYEKVQKQYSNLYNRSLNEDLESELSSEEYNALIRILSAKS